MRMNLFNFKRTSENDALSIDYTNTPKNEKRWAYRKITWLLTKYEHLRDDDIELTNAIWREQIREMGGDPMKLTIENFFEVHPYLTSSEYIGRCRRRLQQLNPELRGKLWDKRHNLQEQAKDELGYVKTS